MFSEIVFQWKLWRMQVGRRKVMARFQERYADAVESKAPKDEVEKLKNEEYVDLNEWDEEIQVMTTAHLVEQAARLQLPLPPRSDEQYWEESNFVGYKVLSRAGIVKVRTDIRAEQKANWEFWANRITLALALIGSIFGVLAYFKK